jgi:cysteinyl-tRNA synthetase
LNDDLNSPIAIAHLFDGVKMINLIKAGIEKAYQHCDLS